MTTQEILTAAKGAKRAMAAADTETKNNALKQMAEALLEDSEQILQANAEDMDAARGTVSDVMLDRLKLTKARIRGMADGMLEVAKLPDPCGVSLEEKVRPNGLKITKQSVPMGSSPSSTNPVPMLPVMRRRSP